MQYKTCEIHKGQKLTHFIEETKELICVYCAFERFKQNPGIEIKEIIDKCREMEQEMDCIIEENQYNVGIIQTSLKEIKKNKENEEKKINEVFDKLREVVKIKRTLAEYWTAERREQFGKLHGGQGHKLNEEEAICIYNKLCDGADRKKLAQEYGVSKSAIDRIANKQYWSIRDSDSCILNRTLPEKYIYQYDLQDRFIRCWRTFDDIHNELCINVGTVCECCNHKREKTKGYKWKYVLILDNGKEIVL